MIPTSRLYSPDVRRSCKSVRYAVRMGLAAIVASTGVRLSYVATDQMSEYLKQEPTRINHGLTMGCTVCTLWMTS